MFVRDEGDGVFKPLRSHEQAPSRVPAYFEECLSAAGLIVLASRRSERSCTNDEVKDNVEDETMQDMTKLFEEGWGDDDSSDGRLGEASSESSPSEFADDSTPDTGEDWTSGAETWSQASTELDDAIQDDNAVVMFKGYVDSSSSSSSESQEVEEMGGDESDNSSDRLGATPFSRFLRGFMDDDSDGDGAYVDFSDEDDDLSDNSGAWAASFRKALRYRKRKMDKSLQASLSVFYMTNEGLRCSFRLSRPLHLILYDSPPVLHPSKPLLIWAISPGNILFADFEQKSWFTRKLRPSASFSRHVFIECHFSPCGQYLHIAALEGRRKSPQASKHKPASSKKVDTEKCPLDLSLFVSTYRLSNRKTTRAPPTQIYCTKLSIDRVSSLTVGRLPFTITWTPTYLYFTRSAVVLNVHKIVLFQPAAEDAAVLVPRDYIFLPYTAHHREICYFPDQSGGNGATILIGSETKAPTMSLTKAFEAATCQDVREGAFWEPKYVGVQGLEGSAALPIGFYLKDEQEFGGWVRSEDVMTVPEDKGVGRLDGKVERFDVEEDCDLEPYIL